MFDSATHVDANGNFHTVWLESVAGDDMDNTDVYYYDTINSTTYNISTALGSGNVEVNNRNHLFRHHKVTSDNTSHIVWRQIMPSGWQDVMYYNSGTNTTTNISTPALVAGDAYQDILLRTTSANNAYVSWIQTGSTPLHFSEMFLFNSATGTTTNLSDHALSQGGVYGNKIFVDSNNYPHVIWLEDNTASSERGDLYYYNGSTGTRQNLTQPVWAETSNFANGYYVAGLDQNNNIHVAWSELNNAGSNYDLFYFSGQTGTTVKVSPNTLPNGNVERVKMLIRSNNQVYLAWTEFGPDSSYDMYLWDESTGITTNLSQLLPYLTGSVNSYKFQVRQNNLGQGFVFWRENTSNPNRSNVLLMYDITDAAITDISSMITTDGVVRGYSTIFDHNGNPVIAFSYFDPLEISHMSDMYVYQGRSNSVTLITNRVTSTGDVHHPHRRIPMNIDENNNPHIFWIEASQNALQGSDIYYYNGDALTTTALTRSDLSAGNVNYFFRYHSPVYIYRNANGRLEALWREIDSNPALSSNLYFWDSDSGTTRIIGNQAPANGGVRDAAILHDEIDRPHIVYLEANADGGEGLDVYYAHIEAGTVRLLTDLPVTALGSNPLWNAHYLSFKIFNGRRIFTTWAEASSASGLTDRYVWMFELDDFPTPTPTPSPTSSITGTPGDLTQTGINLIPYLTVALTILWAIVSGFVKKDLNKMSNYND